jgi:hypothetical protein
MTLVLEPRSRSCNFHAGEKTRQRPIDMTSLLGARKLRSGNRRR